MKLTPWYLAALAPIAIAGCSGAFMGHVAVLAVAIGIFVGTLSLGRAHAPGASPENVTAQVHAPVDKTV
jgi:hypothetical protein